jgi:hypothetical protein
MNPIELQTVSRAARTFTGDFFFTHRHEDRTWIALGDVAGKGLPAAVVMAMIQEELEDRIASCAMAECDPAQTAKRLHEFLAPLLPSNRFATAVIGWLRDDGLLTIVNAGHPSPLVVRNDGTIDEITSTGPLLGVLPNAKWRSMTTQLARGEALVLYSDGVSEAIVNGEELGVNGLRAMLVGPSVPRRCSQSSKPATTSRWWWHSGHSTSFALPHHRADPPPPVATKELNALDRAGDELSAAARPHLVCAEHVRDVAEDAQLAPDLALPETRQRAARDLLLEVLAECTWIEFEDAVVVDAHQPCIGCEHFGLAFPRRELAAFEAHRGVHRVDHTAGIAHCGTAYVVAVSSRYTIANGSVTDASFTTMCVAPKERSFIASALESVSSGCTSA